MNQPSSPPAADYDAPWSGARPIAEQSTLRDAVQGWARSLPKELGVGQDMGLEERESVGNGNRNSQRSAIGALPTASSLVLRGKRNAACVA